MGCSACCKKSESKAEDRFRKRSCTDIFCLFIFLAFIGGMGYVGYLGFKHGGDPYKIVYGIDSWGNTCNRKNDPIPYAVHSGVDTTGMTKTFYFNFFSLIVGSVTSAHMCVRQCPNPASKLTTASAFENYARTVDVKYCRYTIPYASYFNDLTAMTCPTLFDPSNFADGLGEHSSILNRCVPKTARTLAAMMVDQATSSLKAFAQCDSDGDVMTMLLEDFQRTWKEILYLSAISVGVALIITILLRFFACIIIWTLVVGCALGALAGTAFMWYLYFTYKNSTDHTEREQAKDWLIYASVVSAVAFIILLLLLIMRKRIALVVQLFREAGKAIAKMPLILIQPLWTLVALIALVGAIGVVYSYVETSGDAEVDTSNGIVKFVQTDLIKYLKWYYLFGFLWITQFVFASHQMVLAGSVSIWYFAEDKKKMGWPIIKSMWRLIRYHLGTVAFGSFIVALVQFLRIILGFVTRKLRGRTGKVADFMLKCLACCLWCFEKIIKYLNRNAYIMVAIYGYSFCRGARRAFTLLVSNAMRVAAINSVGTFVLLLAKIGVAAISIVIAMEILRTKSELCFIWAPLTVVGIASLLIAHTFLSVYGMAIDTIFLCFCEDCEVNDGVTKPYYMSKGLMEYVSNASEAMAAAKKRAAAGAGENDSQVVSSAPNQRVVTSHGAPSGGVQW